MTGSVILPSFAAGEIAPSLWGRTDLAKFHVGASTMRNMFVNYRGGSSSRAGTRFVGQCRQNGDALPPRLIRFQYNIKQSYELEFGEKYVRFIVNGSYITETAQPISAATQANPAALTVAGHGYLNGDWVAVSGIVGMTALNGRTFIVADVTANTFTLRDTFGDPVNSLPYGAYVSGGTVARLYTLVTPYAATDLQYLKFTQSANVMSLTLSNPETGDEYLPQDLARLSGNSWTIAPPTFTSSIAPPTTCTVAASNTTATNPTSYSYVVTSVDAATGQESQASPAGGVANSVDIGVTAGSLTVTWTAVAGAAYYNIYKAPASVNAPVPIGSSYGYVGTSFGTQFTDSNVVQDFATTPPLHLNPFAPGMVISVTKTASGSGYAQATTTAVLNSATATGVILTPVVVGGDVVAVIVVNGGQGAKPGDTVVIADSGGGTGATFTPVIGPQSGTYPGAVAYFQQRRVYAASLNDPDTYEMSQPGAYTNFDAATPPIESDAVTGTPWASQVNGIQWLLPMPGGLVILTGLDAWQLSGTGGPATPVGPASQNAQPQESNGSSPTVPPIKINYDIIYVQSLGSIVRDLQYNFYTNIYAGTDLTLLANHLFDGYQVKEWAWAREPNKIIWAVRDDGIMLSLTYLKEQEINAWARHDTNGLFVSVASATEPPVDAVYVIVKRYIPGKQRWAYYTERMDNRLWQNAEQPWCVDCALSLGQPTPNATLSAGAASGNDVTFTASAPVFDGVTTGAVGQVIRMGGGRATIVTYTSPTMVSADITVPLATVIPNDPTRRVYPASAGNWSITTPLATVSGLDHIEGMAVDALADGAAIKNLVVLNGAVTLPMAASSIVVGLPFQPQLQSLYLDIPGEPTVQGKRKKIVAVTVRMEKSRGVKVGVDQPNASAQENSADVPWGQGNQNVGKLRLIPELQPYGPGAYMPLYTGDHRINVDGDWDTPGMIALQQDFPLPMNILALVPEVVVGDSVG